MRTQTRIMQSLQLGRTSLMNEQDREDFAVIGSLGAGGVMALVGLFLVGFVVWSMYERQQNNQVVRPFPNDPPAPVVPALPDLIAELSATKSLCEGRAAAAKSILGQRQARAELVAGRRLYDDARAALIGCIDHLRAGLSRRFVEEDASNAAARFLAAQEKVDRFVAWENTVEAPTIGAAEPLAALLESLNSWMNNVSKQNEQAIEQLRADLDRCRLKEWDDIGMGIGQLK
jgi:hypothetical protein